MNTKKIVSVVTIIAVIINFVLLAMGRNNMVAFWSVIVIGAIIAYKVIPKLDK
jgi:hypothetical protein